MSGAAVFLSGWAGHWLGKMRETKKTPQPEFILEASTLLRKRNDDGHRAGERRLDRHVPARPGRLHVDSLVWVLMTGIGRWLCRGTRAVVEWSCLGWSSGVGSDDQSLRRVVALGAVRVMAGKRFLAVGR